MFVGINGIKVFFWLMSVGDGCFPFRQKCLILKPSLSSAERKAITAFQGICNANECMVDECYDRVQ